MNTKKPLSILLTLALVLGLLPWTVMPARAVRHGVSYIDANGSAQTADNVEVVAESMGTTNAFTSSSGWLYVENDVSLSGASNNGGVAMNLILGDDKTLTLTASLQFSNASLTIYGQSGGTGKLTISGSTANNPMLALGSSNTLTINGGTVEATNNAPNYGAYAFGYKSLVMNGGSARFTASMGTAVYGNVTLNGGTFYANGGEGAVTGTVTIKNGLIYKDNSNPVNYYVGTLTSEQKTAINGKTLTPAPDAHNVTVTDGITNGTVTVDKAGAKNGDTVTLTATPDSGFALGTVTVTGTSGTVSTSGTGNTRTFTMPDENVTVSATFTQPAAQVGEVKYYDVQEAINAASADSAAAAKTVTLLRDVTTSDALVVRKTVTLDLAGHTIDRGLAGQSATDSGSVIEVYGSLTLTDSSEDKTGTITGGNTDGAGGGVYIGEGRTFNMTGGTITGNNATGFGGGVCVSEGCTFNVSGSPVISGNWTDGSEGSEADDVQLSATNTIRTYITVTGTLESGASICVNRNVEAGRAFAQAGAGYTIGETDAACFHSDVGDSLAAMLEGNEVMFKKSLTEGMIGAIAAQTYTGSAITPEPVVTDGETTLTKGTDYTVSYSNNVNAAESTAANAPTVTVTGKGSYTGTASKTFTINKKPVTVSGLTAKDKVYDGTTAATLVTTAATFGGICEGDTLAVTATGAFANANAGENKTVNITGLTLGGASKDNYVLAESGQQTETTATITKKAVTVSGITAQDKEYNGDTTATLNCSGATFGGKLDDDTLTVTATGTFDSANKGTNKTVTISGWTLEGDASSNYEVDEEHSQKTATASITGIQVYISGLTASEKVYDGTDAATVTGTAVLKKVNGDAEVSDLTVSDITAKFADKNVGTGKAVTITGGTLSDSTNYTLVPSATTGLTANITAKPVTITGLSAENKVYDGNRTATVTGTAVISGLVSGDTVTVTAGSAAFADENADDGKTVTFSGYALDGADKGNYTLSAQPASVTANITKANATCTAPVAKTGLTYDGSAQALVTEGSAVGGEMQYSLDGNTYGTGIPEGTDAKSYTVYYKVVGDENHNDVAPKSIAVSIAKEDQLAPSLTSPVTIAAPATTAEITGVSTAMEYSTDNKTWTACDAPFSVGKGVYYIRLKADANHNAGSAATVIVKGTNEYALTVTGGTGSGGYEAGASVSVSATVPAGEKFVNWTPTNVTLTDEQKASATVTFTMSGSDVTLTANFEDLTVTGITLNKTSLSLAPNAAATLTVSYQPSGVKDTYKGVTWTSSNESVATVDGSGKVTAKAEGTATITAKSTSNASAEATCTVTVKKQSPTPTPTPSYDPTPSGRDDTPSTPSTTTTTTTDSTTTTNADGGKTESTSKTTETKNSDGSTTAKTTETATTTAADGSKTESKSETSTTTKANTDGTTTAATTATQTATTTDANGAKTTTETKTEAKETLDKSGNGTVEAKTTETVKDANGKVTETTVTESKGTVETAADGAKTTTTTNTATTTDANGNKTTTVTTEQTVEKADGSTGSVVTNENGKTVSASATISEKAVEQAQKSGDAVTVPVTVTATNDAATATAVEITVPQGAESVKVEIPVENVKPGTVAVIVNPDGTEEIVKTSTTSDEGVVLMLDAGATVKLVDNTKPMNDVKGDEWYADNIAWATSHEVMNGVGGGNFAPNDPTTQGMMEQLLYNLDGNAFVPAAEDEAWWSAADRWADGESVTQGLGDAHDPVAPATREVDALMMFNYAKAKGYDVSARADLSRFPDTANVSEEAREALAWAVAAGLINGTTDENGNVILDPQGVATRAQVSAIIERFCENVVK